MSDPLAPPPYAATQQTRVLQAPAHPGSPLEPLRARPRRDRRHWLLAGLLGITGGAILASSATGPLMSLLRQPGAYSDALLTVAATATFGLVAIVAAFALAPGGAVRTVLGILALLVGVAASIAYQYTLFYGTPLPGGQAVRATVSGLSLIVGFGVVGWLLASGARWWAFLAVLLAPAVALSQWVLALQGIPSGIAIVVTQVVALLVALVALVLSIPRRA